MVEPAVNVPADSRLSKAQELFRQDDLLLAETLCGQVLAAQPLHAQALVLTGFIAARRGDVVTALGQFRKARDSDPTRPDIHFRTGLLHQQLGEDEEALECFEQALSLAPGNVPMLLAHGISLKKLARYEEALACYDRAIGFAPGNAEVLNNRAVVLRQLGRSEEALEGFGIALAAHPGSPSIHNNLGVTLHQLARFDEALESFNRALEVKPGDSEILNNKGIALHELFRYEEAEIAYTASLKADSKAWKTLMNLGVTQHAQKRYEQALATLNQAEAMHLGDLDLRMNRANVLLELDSQEEALQEFTALATARPLDAELRMSIGNALREMQRHGEAMAHYDHAVAIAPDNADVRWNRSLCLLALGDYSRGWAEYEWRTKARKLGRVEREFPVPKWLGVESLVGRTILLHAEQGLGDTLLMCRYASVVASLEAKVVLQVQKPLVELLRGLDGVSLLLGNNDPLPDFDVHCPLMSLPHALGTTLTTVPAPVPYLHPEPELVSHWRAQMDPARMRVGVAWAGNVANAADHKRSLQLETFLQALPDGPEYWCLQREVSEHDRVLMQKSGKIQCFAKTDFRNTAAQMVSMDVVLSVDTSIAQLAAALGCKLWVLLAFAADFRWLTGRNDSVWNPTARLFRQPKAGDWTAVMAEVKRQLAGSAG